MNDTMTTSDSVVATIKRYATLAYGALGTMLDTGLVVVGTLLVALGIATLLGGFEIMGSLEGLSTTAVLGSSLILAIVGLFALGVAAEGPLGRGRRLVGFNIWEIGAGRAIAGFLVGFGFLLVHQFVTGLLDDLPGVLERGADGIRSAAIAGMVAVPLVGVPISILLRLVPDQYEWVKRYQYFSIFVVWVVATLIGL